MKKLPDACKDCAEYGSDFCNDCLEELSKDLPEPDKIILSKVLKNIAKLQNEQQVSGTNTQNS